MFEEFIDPIDLVKLVGATSEQVCGNIWHINCIQASINCLLIVVHRFAVLSKLIKHLGAQMKRMAALQLQLLKLGQRRAILAESVENVGVLKSKLRPFLSLHELQGFFKSLSLDQRCYDCLAGGPTRV